jgi:hypothetical protein
MKGFIQTLCLLAIAGGGGLVAFSNKLEPQLNFTDPATLTQFLDSYRGRDQLMIAAATSGVGMAFLILGTLGLVGPWVNKLGSTITGELGDNSARTITTLAVWLSVGIILTFGVFRAHWTGAAGMSVLLILVVVLCIAATVTTAMICGWRPWLGAARDIPEADRSQG